MNCKKCNADLTGKEFRTVAQWNFCLDCFHELINQSEKEQDRQQAVVKPELDSRSRSCVVCEKKLSEKEGRDLLGSLFCDECYENLVKRPPENQAAAHEESLANDNDKKGVAQVRRDFISRTKCYQCGKTIRAIAGREYQGHLFCPDCYFNIPEIKNPPSQATVDVTLQVEPQRSLQSKHMVQNTFVCQTCQRQLSQDNLKIVEGFDICQACLAADPDMALEIARLRHRRQLEEIKKALT